MPKATYRLKINQTRVRALVTTHGKRMTMKAARIARDRVKRNIIAAGRVDTGRMLNSVRHRSIWEGLVVTAEVYSNLYYTIFQDQGTRAHGPARAPFMVFTPKGSNRVVFAKWVRGVKAGNFFENALDSMTLSDFI